MTRHYTKFRDVTTCNHRSNGLGCPLACSCDGACLGWPPNDLLAYGAAVNCGVPHLLSSVATFLDAFGWCIVARYSSQQFTQDILCGVSCTAGFIFYIAIPGLVIGVVVVGVLYLLGMLRRY